MTENRTVCWKKLKRPGERVINPNIFAKARAVDDGTRVTGLRQVSSQTKQGGGEIEF